MCVLTLPLRHRAAASHCRGSVLRKQTAPMPADLSITAYGLLVKYGLEADNYEIVHGNSSRVFWLWVHHLNDSVTAAPWAVSSYRYITDPNCQFQYTPCPEKKETKMFSVISPTKLGQLWWNLAHSFLNKFAATWYKRFPPHLNNVSTLPCETWNAHHARATIALLDRDTPEFILPQLWSPKLQDLNPVDNSMWKILQEGVQNMHHWSGAIDDATDGWLPQWRRDPACSRSVLSRCFSSSRSVMRIFYIFSCDISHIL